MGLDIVTNIMADQASNDLSTNQANMQNSLQQLSSGYRINTAANDASGLVISQHLQAQIGAFQQAQSNTQAGINVVQTADGALNEVSTILQRINTLAVESQNSSATDSTAQQAAQSEVNQALSSITDIANTTVYGDNQLLVNGSSANVNYTFQVGYDGSSSSVVQFSVSALTLANLGLVTNSTQAETVTNGGTAVTSAYGLQPGSYGVSIATGSGAETFSLYNSSGTLLGTTSLGTTSTATAAVITVGSGTAAYTVTINLATEASALTAPSGTVNITQSSNLVDNTGDITNVQSNISQGTYSFGVTAATASASGVITIYNGTNALGSVAVNNSATSAVIDLANGQSVDLTLNGKLTNTTTNATFVQNYSNADNTNYSVTSANAIAQVQAAIQTVATMQGQFGAYQNQLQDISNNETVGIQNLTASNASIMDTNMASQMVAFTQDQVLVQAGVSMLAQANQIPQYVLKLLS